MRITFRKFKFSRIIAIAALILFLIFVFTYLNNFSPVSSLKSGSDAVANAPIFAPHSNQADIDKETLQKAVLEAPEPVIAGDKFAQPAFLEEFGDAGQAQKSQQFRLDGMILHMPEISIEEIRGSADMDLKDPELALKRGKIKEMAKHAWKNYVEYAWGHNEVKPKSLTHHDTEILGRVPHGATIVDSVDTLYIMGLEDEYKKASRWIRDELDFSNAPTELSVFEVTIRFVGGLLSIYSMTKEQFYLDRAVSIVNALLPAFDKNSSLPVSLFDIRKKQGRNFAWASGGCHILSEVGTLHMEFQYISELTGDPKYSKLVHRIRDHLVTASQAANQEFRTHVKGSSPNFCNERVTLSGEGDSFYEYLLKEWIRTGHADTQARELYNQSLTSFKRLGIIQTSKMGSVYVTDSHHGVLGQSMTHLACFAGGMFALGAFKKNESDEWFQYGRQVTETCHKSYAQTDTGLGPDAFVFKGEADAVPSSKADKHYLLRPEAVESYFYMWRFTHDPIYRQYAWEVVEALEKHCRLKGGYSGLTDVTDVNSPPDDVQQSYFIAETLKYLYLIFCDDSIFPVDRWVFNTEAHPFPVIPRSVA